MPLKIAIATNSGTLIDRHFGQVRELNIYEIDANGGVISTQTRPGLASCVCDDDGEHDAKRTAEVLDGLSDCKYVLATRIGPHISRELAARGVTVFELFGEIAPSLAKIARHEER